MLFLIVMSVFWGCSPSAQEEASGTKGSSESTSFRKDDHNEGSSHKKRSTYVPPLPSPKSSPEEAADYLVEGMDKINFDQVKAIHHPEAWKSMQLVFGDLDDDAFVNRLGGSHMKTPFNVLGSRVQGDRAVVAVEVSLSTGKECDLLTLRRTETGWKIDYFKPFVSLEEILGGRSQSEEDFKDWLKSDVKTKKRSEKKERSQMGKRPDDRYEDGNDNFWDKYKD